ncbi:MAG TPA: heat-inducible transcriptional repressor HrcA [Actinomycetes bacterium]|jgi:heat-inducible transcriptional repressor|nr:heat-inducible transcriptional repressor HrcA [Actinomycetes bacterium]
MDRLAQGRAAMNLDERKARLLRAVVHEFIHTAEPVGSRSLTERYSLGVSPATIRNELATLEEQGYLSHPHTSAGRVPTDRGYRFYVDSISGVGELARAQEETIARFFEGAADLEETLQRTSLLLSSLTRYTAMVSPPGLDRSRLRHVELVALGRHVIMLVLIVDSGRVEKRLVETAGEVAPEDLEDLRRQLNERLAGERLSRAELVLDHMAGEVPPQRRALFATVAAAIGQVVGDQTTERVWLGGQANIADPGAFDGIETVRQVYEALEQQVLVLRLLQAALGKDKVSVVIGSENSVEGMEACSLVTSAYLAGDASGSIGVLGPTRMDYLRAMAAVQAVARYLGDAFEGGA